MSDVGKFLFELTRYDGIYFRGAVVSETERTWTAEIHGQTRRVLKAADIVAAPDMAADARARAALAKYAEERRALELRLSELRSMARKAALEALRTGAKP